MLSIVSHRHVNVTIPRVVATFVDNIFSFFVQCGHIGEKISLNEHIRPNYIEIVALNIICILMRLTCLPIGVLLFPLALDFLFLNSLLRLKKEVGRQWCSLLSLKTTKNMNSKWIIDKNIRLTLKDPFSDLYFLFSSRLFVPLDYLLHASISF